jgi:hypothetical protein
LKIRFVSLSIKLPNEELNDLYSSSSIVRLMKSRRMRWAGHVASMGGVDMYTGLWWGNLRERDHLEESGVEGRIILRWILSNWDVGVWTGSS